VAGVWEVWHRQGIRTHKQIVFDDFIAAAEWLIAQHYTSVHRLAIHAAPTADSSSARA